jgi:hypothetical protein
MLSKKIQLLIKRLNPRAQSWYDNRRFLQAGVSNQVIYYTR